MTAAIGELAFLRKLQRLLAEGDFVATYKFAEKISGTTKRDFLAYPAHLERWRESHLERAVELAQRFDSLALPHDAARSRAIAESPPPDYPRL